MTEQELISFLKENLNIELTNDYFDDYISVKAKIILNGEDISESSIIIPE